MPLAPLPDQDVDVVLTGRRWCTPVVAGLTLRPLADRIDFAPGQYVLLQDEERLVPVRSYSVANAPREDGTLDILVTAVPGGATSTWLARDAAIGDRLLASGPYGTFVADPDHAGPTLYLAGGSGLAPALALIEAAVRDGGADDPMRRHTLVFSGRTAEDVIDHERLTRLAAEHPGLDYVRTLTRVPEGGAPPPLGRVPALLPSLVDDLAEHAVHVSGAPGFVDACTRAAQDLGARPGRLHTEEFYAEPIPWHGD
ncbi:FAD-binding oxidoreductase [Janibacter alittae]|uniref:FAD-binding oxidoreductase n=1 Tax=Janibacter alittae TaxID=3115209 RepID=A0ABZ2MKT0_9MICO